MNQSQKALYTISQDSKRSVEFLKKVSYLMANDSMWKSRVVISFLSGILVGMVMMLFI